MIGTLGILILIALIIVIVQLESIIVQLRKLNDVTRDGFCDVDDNLNTIIISDRIDI